MIAVYLCIAFSVILALGSIYLHWRDAVRELDALARKENENARRE